MLEPPYVNQGKRPGGTYAAACRALPDQEGRSRWALSVRSSPKVVKKSLKLSVALNPNGSCQPGATCDSSYLKLFGHESFMATLSLSGLPEMGKKRGEHARLLPPPADRKLRRS
ncbi:hypothetical protein GCM10009850_096880 [Nonomuraea monospora]|uniref:Uncharacterized protein n=1 Tax=Nonomuraea monospora TaxID=568818 RepID=A0ABN3CY83_9ACTN